MGGVLSRKKRNSVGGQGTVNAQEDVAQAENPHYVTVAQEEGTTSRRGSRRSSLSSVVENIAFRRSRRVSTTDIPQPVNPGAQTGGLRATASYNNLLDATRPTTITDADRLAWTAKFTDTDKTQEIELEGIKSWAKSLEGKSVEEQIGLIAAKKIADSRIEKASGNESANTRLTASKLIDYIIIQGKNPEAITEKEKTFISKLDLEPATINYANTLAGVLHDGTKQALIDQIGNERVSMGASTDRLVRQQENTHMALV